MPAAWSPKGRATARGHTCIIKLTPTSSLSGLVVENNSPVHLCMYVMFHIDSYSDHGTSVSTVLILEVSGTVTFMFSVMMETPSRCTMRTFLVLVMSSLSYSVFASHLLNLISFSCLNLVLSFFFN